MRMIYLVILTYVCTMTAILVIFFDFGKLSTWIVILHIPLYLSFTYTHKKNRVTMIHFLNVINISLKPLKSLNDAYLSVMCLPHGTLELRPR